MPHPLDGILERFKRAEENVINLDGEITTFLKEGPYAAVPDNDEELIKQFRNFWDNRQIPPRFGVLISEIAHHLRASLDNLVWQLPREGLVSNPNAIEFPILEKWSSGTNKVKAELNRKVERVTNSAHTLIESLQPDERVAKGPNNLLLILHNINRFDKHRELTVVKAAVGHGAEYTVLKPGIYSAEAGTVRDFSVSLPKGVVKVGGHFTAQVAFRKFGDKANRPVIRGLKQLRAAVEDAINRFSSEFA